MVFGFPSAFRVIGRSVVDWWDSWTDMVVLTVVWLLAQVTIVLGPPATFGYYYAISNLMNGQGTGVHGLIEGARMYFRKSWIWGSVNLLAIFATSFAFWFYINQPQVWALFAAFIVLMVGYLWVCMQFFGLPYFMQMETKDLYTSLKNGLLTALAAPLFTLILILMAILIFGLSAVFVLPIFLGLPGIIPVLGFRGVADRLIAFGLREREKTPKELEMEESSRITLPVFERGSQPGESVGDSGSGVSSAAGVDIADSKRQVE